MHRALAEGDRTAFPRVFNLAWPVLKQYAAKALGNSPEAEDVAQEALLKAFRQASHFETGKDALTWLFTLTTYECMTLRQRTRRRRENYDGKGLEILAADGAGPEQMAFTTNLQAAVHEVLAGLSAMERETILTAIQEDPRPHVAPATFRKRLQRSLDKFRAVWEVKHDDGR